ncbi:GntR family transcriptional regulator [Nonomuraea sp. KC401]|uniref:GntR family transcriptional regulator n=1 Tax=unclassified Nonomuraea TaxID=2593643 RepID=UPI0010FECDA3|nr:MULTISPECIES: GntR family transcriptional regulator [unclassified Nonomuraea]NBE93851.1 UTRA domain-containing protein [Nonomuraea sp. K271]TLF68467.1 GntR family transcriptional regulator [Nonomuraea sp. KC401]
MGRRDTAVQAALAGLRALLEAKFEPGDRLPTEQDLADLLDVSRGTVREALGVLAIEGAIIRRWGVGTFVSSKPDMAQLSMAKIAGFRDRIQMAGHTVELISSSCQTTPCPRPVAEALGLPTREPVWLVTRTFSVDGTAAAYLQDYLPSQIGGDAIDPHPMLEVDTDLFTYLERAGHPAGNAVTDLEAVLAADRGAESLRVPVGFPLVRSLQTVYGRGEEPIAYGITLNRTDVMRIRIIR